MKENFLTLKQAEEYVGGFSHTTKMPCPSWSTPAQECKTGSKLRSIKGTVCSTCYALKGLYVKYEKTVKPALYRRLETIDKPLWVKAFVYLINKRNYPFFRWHDSGDVQSVSHFTKICEIAKRCPDCKFWLPTREMSIISTYINNGGTIPDNLIVRLSAFKLDSDAPEKFAKKMGVQVSTVKSKGWNCPASKNDNACGNCRKCWDKSAFEISYKLH